VVLDVKNKDIIESFIQQNVTSIKEFEWIS
jgi:hypothetical protein